MELRGTIDYTMDFLKLKPQPKYYIGAQNLCYYQNSREDRYVWWGNIINN